MAATLQVMQETWGFDEGLSWAGSALGGGISGMGGICGNVAGAMVAFGLRMGQLAGDDREGRKVARKRAETFARDFFKDFTARYGNVDCRELIPYDLSTPEGAKAFHESGIWRDRCYKYAEHAVRTLFAAGGRST